MRRDRTRKQEQPGPPVSGQQVRSGEREVADPVSVRTPLDRLPLLDQGDRIQSGFRLRCGRRADDNVAVRPVPSAFRIPGVLLRQHSGTVVAPVLQIRSSPVPRGHRKSAIPRFSGSCIHTTGIVRPSAGRERRRDCRQDWQSPGRHSRCRQARRRHASVSV